MPPSDSQTMCRKLVLRSGDTPVAGGGMAIPFSEYPTLSSPSSSSSASLGDLCAFAVKISSSPMAIRGIDFNFGKEPADTCTRDQQPDLRANFAFSSRCKFWSSAII